MRKMPLLLIMSCLMLSGCWDQNLLKEVQLIYTAGYDQTEEGEVTATTLAPPIEETDQVNEITVTGHTVRDSMLEMDLIIAEFADFSKLQTILLGSDLVKDEVYPFLDELYRNPQHNLHARVAVTDRAASELLSEHGPLYRPDGEGGSKRHRACAANRRNRSGK